MSRGAGYLLISVSAFAIVNLCVKALSHLPFEQLVFGRASICLILTLTFLLKNQISPWGNNKKLLLFRGIAGTGGLSCFFYSLHVMPLATAVTIQYLSPVFTVLFAGLIFSEIVAIRIWLGAFIGFLGVYVIQGFDPRVTLVNALIGVVGAMCSALAYNSVRGLRHSDHEWVVMFYFQLVGTALTFPFALKSWIWPQGFDWLKILAIGLLTQVAQLYLTKGYQAEAASKVAAINYLGVVYAVGFGAFFFAEPMPWTTMFGIVVIMFGILVTLKRPKTI